MHSCQLLDAGHTKRNVLVGADRLQRRCMRPGLRGHDLGALPAQRHLRLDRLLGRTGRQLHPYVAVERQKPTEPGQSG